ncbi:SLEI family protein, partial [Reticulomyxa filosa]
ANTPSEYFQQALIYDDTNIDALKGYAGVRVSENQLEKALTLDLNERNADTRVQLSRLQRRIHSGSKGMEIAKELLLAGLKLEVTNVQILEELVELLILIGDAQLAEKYCWSLLKYDPKNTTGLRSIVATSEDKDRVEKTFVELLKKDPNNVTALVEYGSFAFANKRYDKALETLSKAIEIDKANAAAHYLKGFVFIQLQQPDAGLEFLQKAVDIEPNNVYARVNLGQVLIARDQIDKAHEHIYHAYELSRDNPVVISQYTRVLVKKAHITDTTCDKDLIMQAQTLCDEGLQKYPGHVGLLVARSLVLEAKQKYGLSADAQSGTTNTTENEQEFKTRLAPQTAYGMLGLSILKPSNLKSSADTTSKSDPQQK